MRHTFEVSGFGSGGATITGMTMRRTVVWDPRW